MWNSEIILLFEALWSLLISCFFNLNVFWRFTKELLHWSIVPGALPRAWPMLCALTTLTSRSQSPSAQTHRYIPVQLSFTHTANFPCVFNVSISFPHSASSLWSADPWRMFWLAWILCSALLETKEKMPWHWKWKRWLNPHPNVCDQVNLTVLGHKMLLTHVSAIMQHPRQTVAR